MIFCKRDVMIFECQFGDDGILYLQVIVDTVYAVAVAVAVAVN